MRGLLGEIDALIHVLPCAAAVQTSDGSILVNDAAKQLFRDTRLAKNELKEKLTALSPGQNEITAGAEQFSTHCHLVRLRGESLKLCFFYKTLERPREGSDVAIYKACLDAITDLHIIACDTSGKIQYYNDLSARLDNIRKEDALGRCIFDLFELKTESSIRSVLRTGKPVLDWSSTYVSDGQEIPCLGSSYPIKMDGRLVGAISINRSNAATRDLLKRTIDLQRQLIDSTATKKNGTNYTFESIIGTSAPLRKAVEYARSAANSAAPVLVYGETGTGKELFAQSIHNASVRGGRPFVAVNCAAIPETLLESTLFGTSKGAFTGADNASGLFEQAGNGTLFLDEVNSLPLNLQAKLLRVLQELMFRRVGGNKDITVACRVVSSCNCNPLECLEKNTLRKDLYYRLAVICIEVPPLRDRREDIAILTEHFLNIYAKVYGVHHIKVSQELQKMLADFSWPGNIRELRHVIESSLFRINSGEELTLRHLPDIFVQELLKKQSNPERLRLDLPESDEPYDLEERLQRIRRSAIEKALEMSAGNVSLAAKQIGYSRTTLQYQMKKLAINSAQSKPQS